MLNIAKGIDKKKFLHKLEIQFFVTKHFCMKEEKKTDFFKLGILYRHILTCWELDVKYGRILFMALI